MSGMGAVSVCVRVIMGVCVCGCVWLRVCNTPQQTGTHGARIHLKIKLVHAHTIIHTHTHTIIHAHNHTHNHKPTTITNPHNHAPTQSHTITHAHSRTHTLILMHSHTLTHTAAHTHIPFHSNKKKNKWRCKGFLLHKNS